MTSGAQHGKHSVNEPLTLPIARIGNCPWPQRLIAAGNDYNGGPPLRKLMWLSTVKWLPIVRLTFLGIR